VIFIKGRLLSIEQQQYVSEQKYRDHIDDEKGNVLRETPEASKRHHFAF
jgi:hypothetical protein